MDFGRITPDRPSIDLAQSWPPTDPRSARPKRAAPAARWRSGKRRLKLRPSGPGGEASPWRPRGARRRPQPRGWRRAADRGSPGGPQPPLWRRRRRARRGLAGGRAARRRHRAAAGPATASAAPCGCAAPRESDATAAAIAATVQPGGPRHTCCDAIASGAPRGGGTRAQQRSLGPAPPCQEQKPRQRPRRSDGARARRRPGGSLHRGRGSGSPALAISPTSSAQPGRTRRPAPRGHVRRYPGSPLTGSSACDAGGRIERPMAAE